MITVAIIEDNRLVREGMTTMLNELPDLTVVLAATRGDAAALKEVKPRVVLLDVGSPKTNSVRVVENVTKDLSDSSVILMDLRPVEDEIAELVNAGVAGFIMKDASFDELVATIRSVADGQRVLPPSLAGSLFSQLAQDAVRRRRSGVLDAIRMTGREREIIGLIGLGMNNKAIAERLGIASHTVKCHVRNVLEKLSLHSRLQIAAYAHQRDERQLSS